jgi:ABC-type metal ion transport system substrate-binding protein
MSINKINKKRTLLTLTTIGGTLTLFGGALATSCANDNKNTISIICTENPHSKILKFAEQLFKDDG